MGGLGPLAPTVGPHTACVIHRVGQGPADDLGQGGAGGPADQAAGDFRTSSNATRSVPSSSPISFVQDCTKNEKRLMSPYM